jgi:hypothetical protein
VAVLDPSKRGPEASRTTFPVSRLNCSPPPEHPNRAAAIRTNIRLLRSISYFWFDNRSTKIAGVCHCAKESTLLLLHDIKPPIQILLLSARNENEEVKVNKNIAISESGFIFNPGTGDSFSTNSIGQEVIRMLNEGKTRDEITQGILDRYEVERGILEKDLDDYFFMLGTYHILQNGH